MSERSSESAIVRVLARASGDRITRHVIASLQRMRDLLSGDDSRLESTWDEICVQVQDDDSFHWDAYDETVRGLVRRAVDSLPSHEREALWLQTDQGSEWDCEDSQEREPYPVCTDDIVDYLTREYVYERAGSWSNSRIRAYIERSGIRDQD